MIDTIKTHLDELSTFDKIYAGTVVPTLLSFTIYMLIGVPIL